MSWVIENVQRMNTNDVLKAALRQSFSALKTRVATQLKHFFQTRMQV